jgi:hypothetical protein
MGMVLNMNAIKYIFKALGIWLVLNHFRLNYEEYAEAVPIEKASLRYVYQFVKSNRGDV